MKHFAKLAGNVRHVVSTGQNLRGIVTNKVGRQVQFESWLERSWLLKLERDREVKDYGSQPEVFKYVDGEGRRRSYTPDFIVWYTDERIEIQEVSITSRRQRADIKRREVAAEKICQERGWRYTVHTEQTLPQGSELANLLALFRYRPSIYANPEVAQQVTRYLSQQQAVAWPHLVRQLQVEQALPQAHIVAAVGHLIWHGKLEINWERLLFREGELGATSLVWLAGKEGTEENGTA